MEERGYCVFPEDLESDGLVLFHGTHTTDWPKILSEGFKSAAQLKGDGLESVSYAYDSSVALSHIRKRYPSGEVIIIAVRFDVLETSPGMKVNTSNVHVFDGRQPEIIGFCKIPADYAFI